MAQEKEGTFNRLDHHRGRLRQRAVLFVAPRLLRGNGGYSRSRFSMFGSSV